ncbi:MAG: glycosyltransferase [Verrucomicrobiota bacterium]|jgi:glycosyltransferase involved in cell wall biosynthesis
MKLLVFAHVPPPHHGQSYMVQLMLNGFGGDRRRQKHAALNPFGIECYHIDARFSRGLEDIGELQSIKLAWLFLHCLEAIWCRFRHGVDNFYYVPAPGKRVALYRDWLVMLICRPFFKRVILHWHAAGLAKWLETSVQIRTRAITYCLFKPVDLSIVLSKYNFADAEKLLSRQVCIVSNGIPDPCPDFAQSVLPRRKARFAARAKLLKGESLNSNEFAGTSSDPQILKVLFLAHCMKEKGLFDTLTGVALANARLSRANSPIRMHLTVAGEFVNLSDQTEFYTRIAQPDLQIESGRTAKSCVTYIGFANDEYKRRVFTESDCFCIPTYYYAESFGLVAVEAMAFGLPVVTTRWRSLPEIMPSGYPGLVAIKSPDQIADVLLTMMVQQNSEYLREYFLNRFTLQRYLTNLAEAIHSVENAGQALPLNPRE